MKLILNSILAVFFFATSMAANAGDFCFSCDKRGGACCNNNGYLFAYGGISFSDEFTTNILNLADVQTGLIGAGFAPADVAGLAANEDFELDSGFIIGGGAGVRSCFLGGSRFEIEGLFTENDILAITNGGNRFTDLDGEVSTAALMVNFLKEIPVGCVVGYVGGGVGIANVESSLTFQGDTVNDSDFGFAHQFIAGADLPVSDCLSLFLQYKLFNHGDVNLLCPSGVPGVTKFAEFEGRYQSNLVLGARFHF